MDESEKQSLLENEFEKKNEQCRIENYKSITNVIITIGWAATVFIASFGSVSNPTFIFFALLSFSISILCEFFASLSFAKSSELYLQKAEYSGLFKEVGKTFQLIRNIFFIFGFLLFFIILTLKIYES